MQCLIIGWRHILGEFNVRSLAGDIYWVNSLFNHWLGINTGAPYTDPWILPQSTESPRTLHRLSTDSPWNLCGLSTDSPRTVRGISMDSPQTIPGLLETS